MLGRVWVHGDATIVIRRGVTLDGRRAPIELHASHGGTLTIGPDCLIEGGTSIESEGAITLGARVRIGAFVKIIDTHFHPVVGDRSSRPKPSQVVIEELTFASNRTSSCCPAPISALEPSLKPTAS